MNDWSSYDRNDIKNMNCDYMIEQESGLKRIPVNDAVHIGGEMDQRQKELLRKLRNVFHANAKDSSNIAVYVATKCELSDSIVQKVLTGKRAVTADFLGKICVGLSLSAEETDELFKLYGQPLDYNRSLFEAITICAVRDRDSIDSYVNELERYCPKKKK